MPSEYQQDYKKTLAYAPKIYNDPNMTEQLWDIYRALESSAGHIVGCYGSTNPPYGRSVSGLGHPNFKRKTSHWVVKSPTYVNLTSSSKEHQNEKTQSPPPRKKSLSPPAALSKSISSKSTHYTSSSSLIESPTPTHIAPPPKLRFVIPLKLEPHELPLLASSPNNPYVSTMDNLPPSPFNPSPLPRVTRPPPGFPHPPPGFK
ncbi:hypothetical protein Tco_0716267 [Tanacetum coccineum]